MNIYVVKKKAMFALIVENIRNMPKSLAEQRQGCFVRFLALIHVASADQKVLQKLRFNY